MGFPVRYPISTSKHNHNDNHFDPQASTTMSKHSDPQNATSIHEAGAQPRPTSEVEVREEEHQPFWPKVDQRKRSGSEAIGGIGLRWMAVWVWGWSVA